EFVSSEPVRVRRRVEARGQIDGSRILRRNPRREQGKDHEDHDQDRACGRQRIVAGVPSNPAAERDGGGRHAAQSYRKEREEPACRVGQPMMRSGRAACRSRERRNGNRATLREVSGYVQTVPGLASGTIRITEKEKSMKK